ncbi:MAG: hypothetical protein PHI63_02605 [Patescibacteria group bacterium]|nr:hypothetical protein [Patescibacteria group bacterium]
MAPSVYRKCAIGLALAAVVVGGFGLPSQTRTALGSGCTNDTWQCTPWSACSAAGEQTRSCRLLADCPDADDPKPAEAQRCTPPCTADAWACGEWQPCTPDATQTRTCMLELDCPTAETPSPLTTQACTAPPPTPRPQPTPQKQKPTPTPRPSPSVAPTPLPCQNLSALNERIRCRLQLPKSALGQASPQTFPEECRQNGDSAVREQCVDLYRRLQPCTLPSGSPERIACAQQVLRISDVAAAMATCKEKPADLQMDCRNTLRDQVWTLTKFRFDDLALRAEQLLKHGATLDAVVEFTAAVENAKQHFNLATTKEQRRAIIMELRAAWQQLIQTL